MSVGIVVVSHSRALAGAAVDLAAQMLAGRDLRLAVAAGLDETTLGTDALQIKAAVEQVDGPDGVVVLMDLGSAVLSSELALDLLDDPTGRDRVTLSPAPIVEGLVAAAVAAAGGASRAEVAAEAVAALRAKREHLGEPDTDPGSGPAPGEPSAGTEITGRPPDEPAAHAEVTVENRHGLHARPVARLVALAREHDARLSLRNLTTGAGPAAATSPTQLATLGAQRGHRLQIEATGPAARQALDAVIALAHDGFGDDDRSAEPSAGLASVTANDSVSVTANDSVSVTANDSVSVTANDSVSVTAIGKANGLAAGRGPQAVSPGIGIGPARFWRPAPTRDGAVPAPRNGTGVSGPRPVGAELRRLHEARDAVRRALAGLAASTQAELGAAEAAIFAAHEAILDDPALIGPAEAEIREGHSAQGSWARAVDAAERAYAALADPYLRERGQDVRAVGDQVLAELTGAGAGGPSGDGVLVVADLTPAQAAGLNREHVTAIVLAHGSATSHAAILARSRGIPAVAGAGDDVLRLPEATALIVDGTAGLLLVDPAADVLARYRGAAAEEAERAAAERARAGEPAVTRDGRRMHVEANLGSVPDALDAARLGADGAGLVRTEFLFLDRETAPTVAEQEQLYRAIAEALPGRRVTFRTLDVGGDKPLPYLPTPPEANPFLGVRGVRLALAAPHLLRDQLTALVRVAREHPLGIMVPMVSTPGELRQVHAVLDQVLTAETDGTRPPGLELGVMIEVPAAALKAAAFAGLVDFVSIGTNDLTQYTLAAERGHPGLGALADALDPGVLRLVEAVCRAGAGRFRVGVCGEAAADPLAGPVFAALGVTELSVSPAALPAVKAGLRAADLTALADRLPACLALPDAAAVRAALTPPPP
ncbi:phosphoenolpyruvate--protein phosphotransferase [Actinoplanes subtropicus]|uniref:phosphoenolpyruvate--protein phosphotransferase n=1 Tax=Actinoplanes subtropicus TaxID=543632 RepID=UPI0004C455B0|nr:phosphoenolpyruvate--protein phosphotransferase [Actinoplanes subtropicus]